ncbi:MAG TPA: transcriptional regulator [Candidatus Kapabacteria bacterium]|nr:transcriptional regulator [Candidatus Kapabacteria bacterium]
MKEIIANLDKVLDSRIRLAVMSILVVNDAVDFNTLKEMLDVTDGNLASHMNMLEKNKYITVSKRFIGKKPSTRFSATATGKSAFAEHIEALEKLIKQSAKYSHKD